MQANVSDVRAEAVRGRAWKESLIGEGRLGRESVAPGVEVPRGSRTVPLHARRADCGAQRACVEWDLDCGRRDSPLPDRLLTSELDGFDVVSQPRLARSPATLPSRRGLSHESLPEGLSLGP